MNEVRECKHRYEEVLIEVTLTGELCYYKAYHVYEEVRMAAGTTLEVTNRHSLGYILTGMQYATFKQLQLSYPTLSLIHITPLELVRKKRG